MARSSSRLEIALCVAGEADRDFSTLSGEELREATFLNGGGAVSSGGLSSIAAVAVKLAADESDTAVAASRASFLAWIA